MTSAEKNLVAHKLDDLAFSTVEDIARALASRQISALELVEVFVNRIERFDHKLHAYVRVFGDAARKVASASDLLRQAGRAIGPLHGIPIAIKDLFDYIDQPTEAGSLSRRGMMATGTATAVHRLEAAGMVVLGKTHTVEFAFGGWGTNPVAGTPWNPWDIDTHRVPGGSSSGSAVAVAAGLASAALGTDTGGSVRQPAGFCGLVGLKTSRGLISCEGVIPLSPTHDTVGPMTRSVRDAALLLDALVAFDAKASPTGAAKGFASLTNIEDGIQNFRIGRLVDADLDGVESEIRHLFECAIAEFEALGAQIVDVRLPFRLEDCIRDAGEIMSAESYTYLGSYVESENSHVGSVVRQRILRGRDIAAHTYLRLLDRGRTARAAMARSLDRLDAFLAPTCSMAAIPVDQVDESKLPSAYGRFVNFLDLASLSIPVGFTSAGLPAGMQIIVRRFDDPLALRIGRAFERARGSLTHRPLGL